MKNFIFIAMWLLSGCAIASHSNMENSILEADEGILVTEIVCDSGVGGLGIYKAGDKVGGALNSSFPFVNRASVLLCPVFDLSEATRTIKFKEGSYFFGDIGGTGKPAFIDEKNAYKFHIKNNSLNYIGDIKLVVGSPQRNGFIKNVPVGVAVTDQSDKAYAELQKKDPKIFEKYEYIKAVATK